MRIRDLPMIALVLCLSACAPVTAGLIDPNTLYPDNITHCAADPQVPPRPADGKPRTDSVKAQYLEDVHAAGQDCRDTVNATALRKKLYVQQYQGQTESAPTKAWNSLTGSVSDALSSINPF